jgi:hypothetical protein
MVGEEIKITSAVNQRIGIKNVDPDVNIRPKVQFIQATGGKPKKEKVNTVRGKIR